MSLTIDPETVPVPSMKLGSSPVENPMPPAIAGVLTRIRPAGIRLNSATTAGSWAWTTAVCPHPPKRTTDSAAAIPAAASAASYQARTGFSFSAERGSAAPIPAGSATRTRVRGGASKPARAARRFADWPTFRAAIPPSGSNRTAASRAASAEVQKYAPLSFIS